MSSFYTLSILSSVAQNPSELISGLMSSKGTPELAEEAVKRLFDIKFNGKRIHSLNSPDSWWQFLLLCLWWWLKIKWVFNRCWMREYSWVLRRAQDQSERNIKHSQTFRPLWGEFSCEGPVSKCENLWRAWWLGEWMHWSCWGWGCVLDQ